MILKDLILKVNPQNLHLQGETCLHLLTLSSKIDKYKVMPRKIPLIEDQVYHIFNRSINREPIFTGLKECQRAIFSLRYYSFLKTPVRLSQYLEWEETRKNKTLSVLKDGKKKIDIIAYCLMPNHFHFLLRQLKSGGIKEFLSLFQNSYTRYFNTKNHRIGPIFQGYFKSVYVETDEQLSHLSRYIHLNPYSSNIVESLKMLRQYPWSSLSEYIEGRKGLCNKNLILSLFDNDAERYKKFVLNQAEYQRNLDKIKHLTFEY